MLSIFLQECMNFEIKVADKICNFTCLYRSPSQSKDELESSVDHLISSQLPSEFAYLIVLPGGFNAQTIGWFP